MKVVRKARVLVNGVLAGTLEQLSQGKQVAYRFVYQADYQGVPVSLTMPIKNHFYEFEQFPPFFEGLLPEDAQLEALLRKYKLDKNDYFGQLMQVGNDVIGAITVEEIL
jgi:serine/threonine-protein kinase HipA